MQKKYLPTTKIVLDTRYKKGKTFPAKLRITYRGEQKYYPLKISFTEIDWQKMNGNRPGLLKDTLIELQEKEKKAKELIDKMPLFSFDSFENKFLNFQETSTLKGSFGKYIDELRESGQIGNAINYECAIKSLNTFRPDSLLTDVNIEFLKKYSAWMSEQGRSTTTVSMYLRSLRCVINKAKDGGQYLQELYPFGRNKFEIPESRNIKKALTASEIAAIYNHKCDGDTAKARDFWYLIYLCGGINVQDLCLLKYSDIKRNKIEYERSKTARTKKNKTKIAILLTEEIRQLIDKYGQGGDGYIFKVLQPGITPERRKKVIQNFTKWLNNRTKEIATALSIDIPLTTYVARHSYASQLLRSGISISAISKKMHDGNIKTTMNYLSDLSDDQEIEMANAITSFKETAPEQNPLAKIVNL